MLMTLVKMVGMFILAALIGFGLSLFVYYLIAGQWLSRRFYIRSLQYIRDNGCGNDEEENNYALNYNLTMRIRSLYIIALALALVLSIPIGLYYRWTNDLLLSFCAIIGVSVGIYRFYCRTYMLEQNCVTFVGKLIKLEPEERTALFECKDGSQYVLNFKSDPHLWDALKENRGYYAAEYLWFSSIASSNEMEWEDGEWPGD